MINFIIVILFFSTGFLSGWILASGVNNVFDKVVFDLMIGIIILALAVAFYFNFLHIFLVFFALGIIVGYSFFCKPAKWTYDGLKYHKYY